MNNNIKKFLDENLVFTNDNEKSLTFDTVYDVYYLNCKDYGKEPADENEFNDALNQYLKENPRGIVEEEYYITIDKDTLDYYRSYFDSGVLPSEPIPDKKNTFTLITDLKNADKTHTKVLIFSTLGKKDDKELIDAHKSRLFSDDVLIHSFISTKAMEFLKEYISDLEREIDQQASLLAEYEAEQ